MILFMFASSTPPLLPRNLKIRILTGLAAMSLVFAQPETPPVCTLRIITFIPERQTAPRFYIRSPENEMRPIQVGNGSLGNSQPVPSGETLTLFRRTEEEGGPVYHPVGGLEIPQGVTDAVAALLPRNERLQTLVFDVSEQSLPTGNVMVLNLFESTVGMRISDKTLRINPGQSEIISPAPAKENRVAFELAYQTEHGWESLLQSGWRIRSGTRLVAIITANPSSRSLIPKLSTLYLRRPVELVTSEQPPETGRAAPRQADNQIEVRLLNFSDRLPSTSRASVHSQIDRIGLILNPNDLQQKQLRVRPQAAQIDVHLGNKAPIPIRLNSVWRRVILAVTGTDDLTVTPFENSPQSHPPGTLRIFNLSPYRLAYAVNKEVAYLSPMQETVLTNPGAQGGEIELGLAVRAPRGWISVEKTVRPFPSPRQREALFVFPAGKGDDVSITYLNL
jgi:hypothetical protein